MTKIKNIIFLFLFATTTAQAKAKVLIIKAANHPALDATEQGVQDVLSKEDVVVSKVCATAGTTNIATMSLQSFIKKNKGEKLIVVTIGTSPSLAALPAAKQKKIQLFFASVTDPVGSSIAQSLEQPGNNTTGASNFIPLDPQIQKFVQTLPKLKRLGMLYNSSEPNSVEMVKRVKEYCRTLGIEVVTQVLCQSNLVRESTTSLLQKNIDAIFISNDNMALSCIPAIAQTAGQKKVPVFVSDTDVVDQGALMAVGPNQKKLGEQVGRMIARALSTNEDISTWPVELPEEVETVVNQKKAKELNISLETRTSC